MRRIFIITASLVGLLAVVVAANFQFPQITETALKMQCSMTAPSENCQKRMVSMGHVWALKDNLARAAIWYDRAAQAGDPFAMFHLAWVYERAGDRDFKMTVRQAADNNRMNAFHDGPDLSPALATSGNFKLAAEWYRKAADKGFAPAMNNLAELYLSGRLGERNLQQAFNWHLAGARAGNPVAAMNLVLTYKTGMGVPRDPAEAAKWASFMPADDAANASDMTLSRTNVYGSPIAPQQVAVLRASAKQHLPVQMDYAPLKPDSRLPTFHAVETGLGSSGSDPAALQRKF